MGTISIIIPDLGNGLSGFNRVFERSSRSINFACLHLNFDEVIAKFGDGQKMIVF